MRVKFSKTAKAAYIYEDGHCVVSHEKHDKQAGRVEWVEVYEKLDVACAFKGRIVFHHINYDGKFWLAVQAKRIECSEASLENGSENTKRAGIAVGNFGLQFKDGKSIWWTQMPELISDGITYQPNTVEAFNPEWLIGHSWGMSNIAAIYRLPSEPVPQAIAA